MTEKILIEDVVYLVEKKLGLNCAEICEYIYTTLEKRARRNGKEFNSKYMTKTDLVEFRATFISMVDLSKLNPLDYSSFLDGTNNLIEYGSPIKNANGENNKLDPYIKTVRLCR